MSTVSVICYLVVGADIHDSGYCKNKPSVRVSKGKPATTKNEVAIRLDLDLPTALFRRPQITAKVTIPEDDAPMTIEADVQDNIIQAIREASGLDVHLTVGATA